MRLFDVVLVKVSQALLVPFFLILLLLFSLIIYHALLICTRLLFTIFIIFLIILIYNTCSRIINTFWIHFYKTPRFLTLCPRIIDIYKIKNTKYKIEFLVLSVKIKNTKCKKYKMSFISCLYNKKRKKLCVIFHIFLYQ